MNTTDVYIMMPFTSTDNNMFDFSSIEVNDDSVFCGKKGYLNDISEKTVLGMDKLISGSINRYYIGKYKIKYYFDDSYNTNTKYELLDCDVVVLVQKETNLGIYEIILPNITKTFEELSMIGDIVSTKNVEIYKDDKPIFINDKFVDIKNIELCGKKRIVYASKRIKDLDYKSLKYLLAGETSNSIQGDYNLSENVMSDILESDIAQYQYFSLYAKERAILFLSDKHVDDFSQNYTSTSVILYKTEIAILQNAAISRINNKVINEIYGQGDVKIENLFKMKEEYGKTIILWDNAIYNYYLAQNISDYIVKAFGTERLLKEYDRNSKYLNEISNIQSVINSKAENFLLNFVAAVLSFSELIQLIFKVIEYHKSGDIKVFRITTASVAALIIIFFILKKKWNDMHKRKNGYTKMY